MPPKKSTSQAKKKDSGKASGSKKASGSESAPRSRRNNPSSTSFNHNGFAATCRSLRPVVHDKVGYPLFCYLNGREWNTVFPEFEGDGGVSDVVAFQNADTILKDVYSKWVENSLALLEEEKAKAAPAKATAAEKATLEEAKKANESKNPFHEKDLTKALAMKLGGALPPFNTPWSVDSECRMKIENPKPVMTGLIDVLVKDGAGSPVLMLEAGLLNADWWAKVDQGLKYVKGLQNLTKPFLYVVLTVDRVKEVNVIKKDPEKIIGGRIGTFLVTPRSENGGEFRLSLLNREETTYLSALSAHMGRVLRAACLLPKWDATESNYRYLGPSCCRIMNDDEKISRVLRVYDNRLMHTDRRPDLYLAEGLHEGGKKVCEVFDTEDPAEALRFGSRIEAASDSGSATTTITESGSRDWLWAKRGQFLAITVPFRDGRHYAINIKDFKPILTHLRKLHANDYVHGDIRGFNMVMKDEKEGYLIDLDYGGRVQGDIGKVPRYPEGYMFSLPDGARPRRPDRSPISMKDDLQAMANLMFDLHYADDISPMDSVIKAREWQKGLRRRISKLVDEDGRTVLDLLDELLKFADNAKWNVAPTEGLRYALESFGYDVENSEELTTSTQGTGGTDRDELGKQRRVGTDPAPGSPSKRTMV